MFVCMSLCAFEDKMELKRVSVYTYGSLFHSILSSMEVCLCMCVYTLSCILSSKAVMFITFKVVCCHMTPWNVKKCFLFDGKEGEGTSWKFA